MAEAVVSGVVQQLGDLLFKQAKDEFDLLTGVEEEVRNLSNTMKRIQAVLVDAERKRITEESVKIWLQELEDVSYEIDDVLDEWNYQILRKEIEGSSSSNNIARVCFFILSSVCFFNLSSCFWFKELAVNREIAVKIKKLNAKLNFIAEEKNKIGLVNTTGDSQEWRPVQTTSLIDESEVFGRETDKENLISQLLSEDKHAIQVVSITGAGGIGKTTLAQLAYNDDQVKGHYEKRGWVCVSNPFDEIRIVKAILEALHSSSSNLNELNSLLERIRDSISGKKFLLVLDDVWTEDQIKWQTFKASLKHGAPGSTILLTTRSEKVAIVAGATCTIPLGVLSESDSWSLFCKVAFFGRTDQIEHARFETIGREITSKCKGLPLAIKTLGGLLCSKNNLEAWQHVRDSNMWELKVAKVELFPHLYLSYSDLSPPLRRCFLYCAIFPKDYQIGVDDLIKIWLGQGYLNSTESESEMELKGREYFEYLEMRSFFQDFEKDYVFGEKIVVCKMHDIVHDFAQFLTERECLIIEGEKKETFSNNARHLTWFGSEEAIDTISNCNMGQLRSFWAKNFKLDTLLNSLKLVRSLKLNGCSFKELPKNIGNLIHLRYLGLCNNDELKELPTTIYDLYNLQTLDLDGCWKLIELPPGIEKLKKLRHIFPSRKDMNYPGGIGKLTCLQTLKYFVVKGEHNKLGYLKSLNQLRGSLNIKIADNLDVIDAKDADFISKKHIQNLSLNLSTLVTETEAVMEALKSPPNIQILYVFNYVGTRLATSMTSLEYLRHLTLEGFYNLNSLPSLGILPLLEKLKIMMFYKLKYVGPTFLGIRESLPLPIGFPMLEELELISCEEWEEWEDITLEEEDDDTVSLMPRLHWLTLGECSKLKTFPYRLLRKASSLQCIQLDEKKYNPSTILPTTLTLAEVKARKPDYQSTSTKEAFQLKRLEKVIADVWSNDGNLQLRGTIQFKELPYIRGMPNDVIIQSRVIFRFVEFLTREDFPQLQFQAVSALNEMASRTLEYQRVVIDHGVLPILVKLIGSPRDAMREHALLALGNMAFSSREWRDLILEHGALMPLLPQLNEHANVMMLRRGAWVLCSFCHPNTQFEQIKLSLPTLQRLIYSNDDAVLRRTCEAFSRLSSGTHDNIQVVIEADICQRLVELLIHPSPIVLIPTLVTVANIAIENYIQTQFIDNGALPRLLSLLSHNHEKSNSNITTENRDKIQLEAARTLKNIAFGTSENRRVLIDHGAVPIFVKLLGSDVCEQAVIVLGNIAAAGDDIQTQVIIDHEALPCLLSLLTHNHENNIKEYVCQTISNIAAGNKDQKQAVIEAGLIVHLLNLLKTTEFDIKKWAACAISNVTFDVTNEQMKFLVSEGCIKSLCDLLVCPDPEIVTVYLKGLENILVVGEVEKNQGNTGDVNNFAQMIEEAQGLEKIKTLQSHDNDEICERAIRILKTYWLDKEEEEGETLPE